MNTIKAKLMRDLPGDLFFIILGVFFGQIVKTMFLI